jgi:septum formation protein
MAQQKAMTVFGQLDSPSEVVVIGADTCIVQGSDVIGKPNDEADARRILMRLSGKKHQVLSCVCLVVWDSESLNPKVQSKICESEVSFRVISENEIQQYWNTGEPVDKAGAYAIQGRAAIFIDAIHGSYTGIVGLPLYETYELLKSVGVESLSANSPVSI